MPESGKSGRPLKSGYTTGACAAAAAKAAVLGLLGRENPESVAIPFPDGSRHSFALCRFALREEGPGCMATVVKDAGDDPDVTNGAEIGAEARWLPEDSEPGNILLSNGPGVGMATKPGLAVAAGEAAINPVPRRMIREAVTEALAEAGGPEPVPSLAIQIFVRDGEILAEKTLNRRLGVIGGLSILGTTGIVRPLSAKAWTDTIEASMRVARAAGLDEAVLSTGRTSEAAIEKELGLPPEALVMMGDYLHYSLEAGGRHGFARLHLAAMWAKLVKAALGIPQTHVRNGALEVRQAAELLEGLGLDARRAADLARENTARALYDRLRAWEEWELIRRVCLRAREQAMRWSGLEVLVYLISAEEGVVCRVPD